MYVYLYSASDWPWPLYFLLMGRGALMSILQALILRLGEWKVRPLAVEDDGDLLQRAAASLGVEEPDGDEHDQQDDNKDDVVFPLDAVECDGIDESVEEDSGDASDPGDR